MAAIAHTALIAWVIIICLPLLWVLMSSFKTTQQIFGSPFSLPTSFNFDNYISAWTTASIGTYFVNTVIVVGSSLVIVMLLGAMCAYYLARYEFKGSQIIYYLMLAGLTFPIFLAVVPLFNTLKGFGILNTLPGLIITYVAFALPFTVFFLYAFFKSLPQEVAEAAALDGCGPFRIFFQIMLPMATPGIASVAIFNFLGLVEPVPAADRAQPQRQELRAVAGHGDVRLAGRLCRQLRRAVRGRGDHGAAGARHLHHLPAPAAGLGLPGPAEVAPHSRAVANLDATGRLLLSGCCS